MALQVKQFCIKTFNCTGGPAVQCGTGKYYVNHEFRSIHESAV